MIPCKTFNMRHPASSGSTTTGAAPTSSNLLQESGSYILQEDNTSKIIL